MKFILNENKKFILEEKFILQEATALEIAKKWVNELRPKFPQIKTKLTDIQTKANNDKSKKETDKASARTLVEKSLKDLEAAKDSLELAKNSPGNNLASLQSELAACVTTIGQIVTNLKTAFPSRDYSTIDGVVNKLGRSASVTPWTEPKSNLAIRDFNTVYNALKLELNNISGKNVAAEASDAKKELLKLCEQAISALGTTEATISLDIVKKISQQNEADLNEYVRIAKELSIAVTKLLGIDTSIRLVLPNVNKILTALNKAFDDLKKFNGIVTIDQRAKQIDWAMIYSNLKTPEKRKAFWDGDATMLPPFKDGYYKTEWGTLEKEVKGLGIAFINILVKIGWTAANNPIISFLKKNENLLTNKLINEKTFTKLYNALAKNELSLKDFDGAGTFGTDNIIFNEKLYSLAYMSDYLALQYNIKSKSVNFKTSLLAFYQENTQNKGIVLKNFMYINGDMDNLNKDITPGNFRSITAIEELIKIQAASKDDNEKLAVTNDDISDLMEKVTSIETAKKILSFLMDALRIDFTPTLNKIDEKLKGKLAENKNNVHVTNEESEKYIKALKFDTRTYDTKTVEKLLLALAKKAGFVEEEAE